MGAVEKDFARMSWNLWARAFFGSIRRTEIKFDIDPDIKSLTALGGAVRHQADSMRANVRRS
jgi:hypothetical protein